MNPEKRTVAILGAGIAGLSIACELSESGNSLTIVEKSPCVGGIARSVKRDGYIFDLGGHRICSDKQWIIDRMRQILEDDLQLVKRKSRIRLGDKFIDYPPRPLSIPFVFGLREGSMILSSYVLSALKSKLNPQKGDSFEQWITGRFGTKMYEIFFKPYTEKVCGLPCSDISVDWGTRRVGVESLFQAVKKAVFTQVGTTKTYATHFYYPQSGIGTLSDRMADTVSKNNSRIMLGWEVKEVRWTNGTINSLLIEKGDEQAVIEADRFISTIPLTRLVSLMKPELPAHIREAVANLEYRALVCIMLVVDRERITDDHWIYFPDTDVIFTRVHEPKNWSHKLARDGRTSLCVEIMCNQDDGIWQAPDEQIIEKSVADLSRLGFLSRDDIADSFVERVPYAYPLLRLGYQEHLAEVMGYLSQIGNLHLSGRTGAFKYWGMDDVIEEAVLKTKQILC